MSYKATPSHGKLAMVYVLRPNGFKGAGLNDLAWGTGYNGAASGYFEVVIDGVASPNTFKWRKNGGAWTETVAITGSAQTLSDTQTVTFGAVTGHTLADQWVIGNLKVEPCTEATNTAQITDATKRVLNPNHPPTFTDSGGETVTRLNFTSGLATFTANVAAVTATGNNGFIPLSGLQKVGYLIDWSLNLSRDFVTIERKGQDAKETIPGQYGGSGSANAYFIGAESFFSALIAGEYYFLQLFTEDPDQDQTGDHFRAWVALGGMNPSAPIGDVVKEAVSFTVQGEISINPAS